ncbi:hypothetical protein V3W47_09550 [Deinococcus sp. YIM 134068]|uniref:hypothetical protein n=1 Tax=Deinococcus lichenicola TaxID=3118910 RepID=UPI002F93B594
MPPSPPPQTITFVIPALKTLRRTGGQADPAASRTFKLVGYYTQGATPNRTRLGEYHTWKDHVRLHAPPPLLRLRPVDEVSRVRLDVVCYFATRTHADPENVRKGIVDALFPRGDKWVYGSHDHPHYDPAHPRVEVTVTVFAGTSPALTPDVTTGAEPEPSRISPRPGPRPRRPGMEAPSTGQPRGRKTAGTSSESVGTGSRSAKSPVKQPPPRPEKAPSRKTPPPPAAPTKTGLWASLSAWLARLRGEEPEGRRSSPPASPRPRRRSRGRD